MVERYIEVSDEYIKQLEQEMDNLKKINEKHKKLNGELREENKKQKEVIDKAIEKLYCWGETLDPAFQKDLLDILKGEQNG